MKTNYRTVSNGSWETLQYEAEVTNLFWRLFGFTKEWRDVPRPYYHRAYGRRLSPGNLYVNSMQDDLEEFVRQQPDINEYLKIYEEKQAGLEAEVARHKAELKARRSIVRYFD